MRDIYATFVDTKTTTIIIRKFSLINGLDMAMSATTTLIFNHNFLIRWDYPRY